MKATNEELFELGKKIMRKEMAALSMFQVALILMGRDDLSKAYANLLYDAFQKTSPLTVPDREKWVETVLELAKDKADEAAAFLPVIGLINDLEALAAVGGGEASEGKVF